MSKGVQVALIIGFFLLFTIVFGFTVDRFYPEPESSGLGSYAAMLGGDQPTEYPVRSLVLFMVYLVVGFAFVFAAVRNIGNSLMANAFAWPGVSLVATSIYKLHYSSLISILGSGLNPPVWALLLEWLAVLGMLYFVYSYPRTETSS